MTCHHPYSLCFWPHGQIIVQPWSSLIIRNSLCSFSADAVDHQPDIGSVAPERDKEEPRWYLRSARTNATRPEQRTGDDVHSPLAPLGAYIRDD